MNKPSWIQEAWENENGHFFLFSSCLLWIYMGWSRTFEVRQIPQNNWTEGWSVFSGRKDSENSNVCIQNSFQTEKENNEEKKKYNRFEVVYQRYIYYLGYLYGFIIFSVPLIFFFVTILPVCFDVWVFPPVCSTWVSYPVCKWCLGHHS